jgi:thiol-disulfide isomerase/thioredoxin
MYKRLIVYFLAVLIFAGCKNNNIEIKGKLENTKNGEYLYLEELKTDNLIKVDSVLLPENGDFSFSRRIEAPAFYLFLTGQASFLTMLLEPGQNIELKAYADSLNYPSYISGSPGTESMIEYNKELQKTIRRLSELREIYIQNLSTPELPLVMDRLDSTAQAYLNEINSYTKKYINQNLTSLVSLVALYQQVAPREYVLPVDKDFKYYIRVDSALSLSYPDYEPVKTLHKEVQQIVSAMNLQNEESALPVTGTEAPEIILPDPQGDTIRLSSTRGNIVLLDFWASWCPPCRQQNPNLVKAYELWHSKGFEIYQVSLDKTREAWLKGIRDDQLGRWIHVSDIKYWNSVVVPLYKIDSIPSNLLLDKDGRIIAANLKGEMLQMKLTEIFNTK